jgi:hypothetical protein
MTVMTGAFAVGISVLGLSSWSNIWIYLVANLAGGAVKSVWQLQKPGPQRLKPN